MGPRPYVELHIRPIKRHSAFVPERRLSRMDQTPCTATRLPCERLLMAGRRPTPPLSQCPLPDSNLTLSAECLKFGQCRR